MAQSSSRRVRCDYKRLCALKGLERLKLLVPNAAPLDEVKVIIDSMFYLTQLEVKAEQLKKSLRKNPRSEDMEGGSSSRDSNFNVGEALSQVSETGNMGNFPEDLLDLDDTELKELHAENADADFNSMSVEGNSDDFPSVERQDSENLLPVPM